MATTGRKRGPRAKAAQRRGARGGTDLAAACAALGRIAPLQHAQSWDNVGLLAGDRASPVRRVLLCIDLMPAVVAEAIAMSADLVVAYHPPIFRPITRLVAPGEGMEAGVLRCVANGIAVYSPHTALDVAPGGTNDVLADLCGVHDPRPIERSQDGEHHCRVVVTAPAEEADRVADAMFQAGAGRIGDYTSCSFRIDGTGTFLGGEDSNPARGRRGAFERVAEQRIAMVCSRRRLNAVLDACRRAHSYEEPAIDVYPLIDVAKHGIGRVGALDPATTLGALARRLKRKTGAGNVAIVGDPEQTLTRALVCVGAAGSLPFSAGASGGDVIVTGEIRHHDALRILRRGCAAIALSHWSSERPALASLAQRLQGALEGVSVTLSLEDREPFVRL